MKSDSTTGTFTLIPESTSGAAAIPGQPSVSSYIVGGLPLGQQATIARRDGAWSIWHVGDGSPDEWHGRYASPEQALEALQATWGQQG